MRPRHARPATKADETEEFRTFWEIWTRGKCKTPYCARAAARDSFFRHVWWKGADPQDIIDGALHYEANLTSDRKQYKVENWLDKGFYEDDADRWRETQRRLAEIEGRKEQGNVLSIRRAVIKPSTINEDKARHAQETFAKFGLRAAE